MTSDIDVEVVVVGAGVVGLAIARALSQRGQEVVVFEAAACIGDGVSGRNSGVIHGGIYYPERSLKAQLCVEGRKLLYQYCLDRGVAHRRTGKLIVAIQATEIARLETVFRKGVTNGVDGLEWLDAKQVKELEPDILASAALYSPQTGIVDVPEFMLALEGDIQANGGMVFLKTTFLQADVSPTGFRVEAHGGEKFEMKCKVLINAAGLESEAVAKNIHGLDQSFVRPVFYCKGHYFKLQGRSPFAHLIYPLPGDGGLGVHSGLDMSGFTRFGPDVSWEKNLDYSFDEGRKKEFVSSISRYWPALDPDKLQPDFVGVRPKISGPGEPDSDFHIVGEKDHGIPGLVSLQGIESPGLTSSLAIGEFVANLLG